MRKDGMEGIEERAPPRELSTLTMGDYAVRLAHRSDVGFRCDVSHRGDRKEYEEGDHSKHFCQDVVVEKVSTRSIRSIMTEITIPDRRMRILCHSRQSI
jgi:hypothetical protein